jgi:hypothetical protein
MTSLKIGNENVPFSDIKAFEPLNDPPHDYGIAIVTHDGRYYLASGFRQREPRDEKLKELNDALAEEWSKKYGVPLRAEQHEQQHEAEHDAPRPIGSLPERGGDDEDERDEHENQGD